MKFKSCSMANTYEVRVTVNTESLSDGFWIPLTLRRPGLVVVGAAAAAWVAVGRSVLVVMMVSPVGQAGHVGVVQVDVGGLGGLAVGVVVAVMVVVVVVVSVMVVGVGHGVGARQPPHRLLHVSVMGWRLHL